MRAGVASIADMRPYFFAILIALFATCSRACDLALVLAVDVSGSVDAREYDVQMRGLATALRDGIVREALVESEAMVTLIQWTGSSRQRQTIPWTQMRYDADVGAFAEKVSTNRRVWRNYSTAIGEALVISEKALTEVPQCRRKVIDVSGDGISNEGIEPVARHPVLKKMGVIVNALAIETGDEDLTGWFYENLIMGPGAFVITANGFEDYPEQIRRKLIREITKPLSMGIIRDHR